MPPHQHPDWVEPRCIPALTQWFCADLKEGVRDRDHHLGLAHKLVNRDSSTAHRRLLTGCPERWFGPEVEPLRRAGRPGSERPLLPARSGQRTPPFPVET